MDMEELAALDDGMLIHCFSFLTLQQRHRTLPLVCQRWRHLLDSPQLLQRVTVRLDRLDHALDRGAEPLRALFGWLRHRAAPHVQQLEVWLGAGEQQGGALADDALARRFAESLAACGAPGRLASLRLHVDSALALGQQELGALRSLRWLRIDAYVQQQEAEYEAEGDGSYEALSLDGLAALTTLAELRLGGGKVNLSRGLPPSLVKLYLDGYLDSSRTTSPRHCLPRQLESLTQLRSLGLSRVYSTSPDDYLQLQQLTQLERLSLANCTHLPACLSALNTLRVLRLDDTPHGWYGRGNAHSALGCALRQLSLLTHLALRNVDCLGLGLPAELGSLACLHSFCWLQQHEEEGGPALSCGALPAGPWLASLRRAALSSITAAANLQLLSAGQRLEALVVVDTLGTDSARSRYERHPAIAAWANQHPTLRRLGICASELPWLAEKTPAWRQLCTRVAHLGIRPSLSIESGTALMCQLGFMSEDSTDTTF